MYFLFDIIHPQFPLLFVVREVDGRLGWSDIYVKNLSSKLKNHLSGLSSSQSHRSGGFEGKKRRSSSEVFPTFSNSTTMSLVRYSGATVFFLKSRTNRMISTAGFSLISRGRLRSLAASAGSSRKNKGNRKRKKEFYLLTSSPNIKKKGGR